MNTTTSPMQYLDKAMNALHDMGLVPSDDDGQQAPIMALLKLISDLDQDRITAIARTDFGNAATKSSSDQGR